MLHFYHSAKVQHNSLSFGAQLPPRHNEALLARPHENAKGRFALTVRADVRPLFDMDQFQMGRPGGYHDGGPLEDRQEGEVKDPMGVWIATGALGRVGLLDHPL
jgi:hypothetical protein